MNEQEFRSIVLATTALPPDVVQAHAHADGFQLCEIEKGIVYSILVASLPDVVALSLLGKAISAVQDMGVRFHVLEREVFNNRHIEIFGRVQQSVGDVLWVREGRTVATRWAIPVREDEFVALTRAVLS